MTCKNKLFAAFCLLLAGLAWGLPSQVNADSQVPRLISQHGDWNAYVVNEGDKKFCYMASTPKKNVCDRGACRRGDILAFVTHRPYQNTKNVFGYMTGYTYKPGSTAKLKIDDQTFTLITQKDYAWSPNPTTDENIIEALRKGYDMVVMGTSSRGTNTTDTYSLKGSAAAHDAITKACGL